MPTKSIDLTELENKMRPGLLSEGGFLGNDESLQLILAWDEATLKDINVTSAQIAGKLESILNLAMEQRSFMMSNDPEQFQARDINIPDMNNPQNIPQYSLENLPDLSAGYLVGKSYQAFVMMYRGMQTCPWGCASVKWNHFDFLILNRRTGRQITGPGLIVHLIREHGFFEGFDSPYRVDPWRAADVLSLGCRPCEVSDNFTFQTDPYSDSFCNEIVEEMQSQFGISQQEAIARVNRQWRGQSITGIDIVYYETPEFWANEIYWEAKSYWWIQGKQRNQKNLPPLKARPAP